LKSLRQRTNPSKRAGGKGARTGLAYINGAVFNPAALMAFLNIFRDHSNWFEPWPCKGPGAGDRNETAVGDGVSSILFLGTKGPVKVPKFATTSPVMLTSSHAPWSCSGSAE
jgi:hypothetical protein